MPRPRTVLFGGYAPVHFVCFRPIYEALRKVPGVEVYLTGGKRSERNGKTLFDPKALYRPFGVPPGRILTVKQIARRDFDMTFSAHTAGFFPRRTKTRIQVFHGLSFRNLGIREDQKRYDALLTAGPYMMRGFRKLGIPRRKTLPVGFVKMDCLRDGSLDRAAILKEIGFRGDRPVLLYAPTGDRKNSLETMGEEVIRRIKAAGRWDLMIKLHDHPKDAETNWPGRLRRHLGPHVKLVKGFNVCPYLFVADLLISDASSVASEYSLMDRPMIFLDVPGLIARARKRGGMVDLRTWGRRGGVTVRRPAQAVVAIRKALANPGRGGRIRRAMARDLFFDPGHATDRAVAWILKKLGVRR